MGKNIKLKGRLKTVLHASLFLGLLLAAVNLLIYVIDFRAGLVLSAFVIFYFAILMAVFFYNKPIVVNELISFATQYGQIQKKLLRELELPHVLLDENGKVIWANRAFEKLVGREKEYRKSITALFPVITKDKKIKSLFSFSHKCTAGILVFLWGILGVNNINSFIKKCFTS